MLNYDRRPRYDDLCDRPNARIDNDIVGIGRGNSEARRPMVFLYSHDTYGLGHLRRNLAIAEHLLARPAAFSVRLLTGSPVIGSWALPDGLDVTTLEPVIKTGVVEGARIAKLNELIRIEHFLGNRAKMADLKIR